MVVEKSKKQDIGRLNNIIKIATRHYQNFSQNNTSYIHKKPTIHKTPEIKFL